MQNNLDLVSHAQDHFRYGYHFVNSDLRQVHYLEKLVIFFSEGQANVLN